MRAASCGAHCAALSSCLAALLIVVVAAAAGSALPVSPASATTGALPTLVGELLFGALLGRPSAAIAVCMRCRRVFGPSGGGGGDGAALLLFVRGRQGPPLRLGRLDRGVVAPLRLVVESVELAAEAASARRRGGQGLHLGGGQERHGKGGLAGGGGGVPGRVHGGGAEERAGSTS